MCELNQRENARQVRFLASSCIEIVVPSTLIRFEKTKKSVRSTILHRNDALLSTFAINKHILHAHYCIITQFHLLLFFLWFFLLSFSSLVQRLAMYSLGVVCCTVFDSCPINFCFNFVRFFGTARFEPATRRSMLKRNLII